MKMTVGNRYGLSGQHPCLMPDPTFLVAVWSLVPLVTNRGSKSGSITLRARSDNPNLLEAIRMAVWSGESKACFQSKKRRFNGLFVISDHSMARPRINRGSR